MVSLLASSLVITTLTAFECSTIRLVGYCHISGSIIIRWFNTEISYWNGTHAVCLNVLSKMNAMYFHRISNQCHVPDPRCYTLENNTAWSGGWGK